MIKLGDVGLVVQLQHTNSVRNTVCGTPWYMAPEAYDEATELRSDVWALGISLIEMAEKHPYGGLSPAKVVKCIVNNPPPSLSSSKWSAAFVDFVKKCLVKDVEERWSVSQLMEVSAVLWSHD